MSQATFLTPKYGASITFMQTDPEILDAESPPRAGVNGPPPRPAKIRVRTTVGFMLSHPLHLISLGFGSGLARIAPGTVGTLFAWLSFIVLDRYLSETAWAAVIGIGFVAGIWITGFTARRMGIADPSPVVWDEIIAFWLIMLLITPATGAAQFGAFVVFRFFDAVKPPPIGYLDRRVKGGLGIMLDDLAAAFCSLLVIAVWRAY
jgi:phosphatidylglycerophosphatase A